MPTQADDPAGEIMRRPRSGPSEREGVACVDAVELALQHFFPANDPPAWMWRGGH